MWCFQILYSVLVPGNTQVDHGLLLYSWIWCVNVVDPWTTWTWSAWVTYMQIIFNKYIVGATNTQVLHPQFNQQWIKNSIFHLWFADFSWGQGAGLCPSPLIVQGSPVLDLAFRIYIYDRNKLFVFFCSSICPYFWLQNYISVIKWSRKYFLSFCSVEEFV